MLRTLPALAVVLTLGLAGCGSAEKAGNAEDAGSAGAGPTTSSPTTS
ncbi:MAG: hypothetical protein JWR42_167, partial [Marmoricola sp.]|nr:hypothetical protein [Marmoricola sp.]